MSSCPRCGNNRPKILKSTTSGSRLALCPECRENFVITALAELPGRPQMIAADPPWAYGQRWETRLDGSGKCTYGPGASGRYPVMTVEEIMAIPVGALAAEESLCFLWITGPHLVQGAHHRVLEAWGFVPATVVLLWVKMNVGRWRTGSQAVQEAIIQPQLFPTQDPLGWILAEQTMDDLTFPGTGNYSFSNAEYLVVGRRGRKLPRAADPIPGHPGLKPKERIFKQILYAPVGEHSAKPQEAYDRLDWSWPSELYPSRLDIFGRTGRPGWHVIGNQAPQTAGEDITESVKRLTRELSPSIGD